MRCSIEYLEYVFQVNRRDNRRWFARACLLLTTRADASHMCITYGMCHIIIDSSHVRYRPATAPTFRTRVPLLSGAAVVRSGRRSPDQEC